MEQYAIKGGNQVRFSRIGGAKNAALAILATSNYDG